MTLRHNRITPPRSAHQQGTLPGVSSFQIQIADYDILTAGDRPDVLVAMNPAALKANVSDLPRGGLVIANSDEFTKRNLAKVGYEANPLETDELSDYVVQAVAMTTLTLGAVESIGASKKDGQRAKNMFALGLLSWMYGRELEHSEAFIREKFARKPEIAEANVLALKAGWNYGETTEAFASTYEVAPAKLKSGEYRQISGNTALAYGLVTAGQLADIQVVLGTYPITPASDILHELSKHKNFNVLTFQAEDEIAGIGAAIGASYGGALGVTSTSGPGIALKSEAIGLAVMTELPLIVIDVQRGGPSTGLPTKTEQADLLQALYGRNGESPVAVLAPRSPSDCFDVAVEAARIAITYHTPVMILSDGAIANGSEPWRIPDVSTYRADRRTPSRRPVSRSSRTPAIPRRWPVSSPCRAHPGLEHRIGGLEAANGSGNISYEPKNHDLMVRLRQAKIDGIAVPDLEVDDPTGDAELLMLGWGSSYGPIGEACRRARRKGIKVAHAQLRNLNPFPANLGEVLRSYPNVVLPGDEPRPVGAAAARQVPGRRAVGDQGGGHGVPGRRGRGHHRRRAGRNAGRKGKRQGQVRPAGGGHRGNWRGSRRMTDLIGTDLGLTPGTGGGADDRRAAEGQGLHQRPGGPLVPRLR